MNIFAWFWSFCIVAAVLYAALVVWFLNGWNSIPVFYRKNKIYSTKVSVIVPFFNNGASLKKCIDGLIHQSIQTTEYEIILVNDHSVDESELIAKEFAEKYRRITLLQNNKKGKKQALLQGIAHSTGSLVVTTDADCSHPEFWLANIVEYYELHNPNMIVGPVVLKTGNSLFQKFQQIEFISLVATGAGAIGINHPVMCNGANLAFKKSVFLELDNPLNLKYASGDDVFLLHNMKKVDADKIHFLKSGEAMVVTNATKNIKSLFKQRGRWVSKASGYTDGDTKFTAFVVFITSFLLVMGLGLMVYNIIFWKPVLFLFLVKTIVDTLFLNQVLGFFKQKALMKLTPVFEFFYVFYVSVTVMLLLFNKKNLHDTKLLS